jgi:hypothetical protein
MGDICTHVYICIFCHSRAARFRTSARALANVLAHSHIIGTSDTPAWPGDEPGEGSDGSKD